MWTFGWNDAVLYATSLANIAIILSLKEKKPFRYQKILIYIVMIGLAILASLASVVIKPDSLGALMTRSIVFVAVSVYFLSPH